MKSNAEWERWGELDPLHAVASWPGKQAGAANAWTPAEFYALGESDWRDFSAHWRHYGLQPGHCVEIGCGAGRLTKHLAQDFQTVTALDVSPAQTKYARAQIPAANVTFCVTDGVRIPLLPVSAQAVFSTHVFQHFDQRTDAIDVLREAHRVLAAGGTLMIHLPLLQLPPLRGSGLIRRLLGAMELAKAFKAATLRRAGRPVMRMLCYEKSWLVSELCRLGFARVEFRSFPVKSNQSLHDFVLATKPSRR
jgi:ubiquinone/menaquinone biosynthesis C-methylase UbiE